jgi:hypothetical protein
MEEIHGPSVQESPRDRTMAGEAPLGAAQPLHAGDKKPKKKKTSFFCRIPIVKRTPLCPLYNKQQIERLAPRMPTYGGSR